MPRQISTMRSASAVEPGGGPSISMMSTAPASVGKPKWNAASTAPTMVRSIISSAAGTMPAAITPETVAVASATVSNTASKVVTAAGIGSSRKVAAVTIPKVPSEPHTTPVRS